MSNRTFIVLSGDYIGPELVAEFGLLPPSMLPNGGRPLWEAQCDMAEALGASAVIVLPHDYALPEFDRERMAERDVKIVHPPQHASMIESLKVGLAADGGAGGTFVLFGDTLVPSLGAWPADGFAAGRTNHVAVWAEFAVEAEQIRFRKRLPEEPASGRVVAGFFHFSDPTLLAEVVETAEDIIDILNRYSAVRPMRPVNDVQWLDFGHLFTYHQSRCRELLARSFNQVTSDGHSVVKSGEPARKIYAEAQWYRRLPAAMRPFAPHFLGERKGNTIAYEMEYLYLPLLSELYSLAHLPVTTWLTMLESCKSFLEMMQRITPEPYHVPQDYSSLFFDEMIGRKTEKRLDTFARERGLCTRQTWMFNGKPYLSLEGLAEQLTGMIRPTAETDIAHWHGDFHFGNIFYDFRSRKVRVVDPRGLLPNGMLTSYGDVRYDISKLGHSIYGYYDFLIADRYRLNYDGQHDVELDFGADERRAEVIRTYSSMKIGQYSPADREAIAMVALLFLSMLPLHAKAPKRQMAFLANAMRLSQMAEAA